MAMDRFLIAPLNSGLVKNSPPWLQPEDAFEYLQNAYVFRQRVRKRYGSEFMGSTQLSSRLRINIGTEASHTIPGDITQLKIGQMFSAGTDIFTVYQLGAAALTYSTNPAATATINNTVNPNTITFTGVAGATPIYYYPANPVMGIEQYEVNTVNNNPTFAWDTQFAYRFTSPSGWERSGTAQWFGDDLNFFWACNWESVAGTEYLFVTNYNADEGANKPVAGVDDPIWYMTVVAGVDTWTAAAGVNAFFYRPANMAPFTGPFVQTARIIVVFKNRLILLNTIENDNANYVAGPPAVYDGTATAYTNRARYSFYGSPLAQNAWYEKNQQDNAGGANSVASGGGFVDAATDEAIISAEFIKDRLIVYFERSTWELVYTNNQVLPFVWQKINTELGSMSTFSTVPFDREVLTIGQSGVHSCSGANVARIDDKIPNQVFEFETGNEAMQRTVGIRDYYTELVYWTYLSNQHRTTQTYPDQIMIYNYKNGSWAFNDDCATMFGYFEQTQDKTWVSTFPLTWEQANFAWNSNVVQSNQRQIIYGTPEGFTLILNPEQSRNYPSMQITNMAFAATGLVTLTIIDHNLSSVPRVMPYSQDFVLLENIVADATTMATLNGTIFSVQTVVDADTIIIDTANRQPDFEPLTSGTYLGAGTAARVSNIQIKSKQWNPYVNQDRNFHLAKIDFGVVKTETGAITVDYYPSSTNVGMIQGGIDSSSIMGNSILETFPYNPIYYPLEQFQELLWHPIYFQTTGTFVQIGMYMTIDQMVNPSISLVDFELQALTLYCQPTSSRME